MLGRPPGGRLSRENPGWWLETGRGVTRTQRGGWDRRHPWRSPGAMVSAG